MRFKSLILSLTVVAMAMPLLYTAPAQAQASRTWVSGVGDDVNPCSRTAPCKTWAGAISKTAGGGEISVLDPGGFGAVTITKSITIDGGGGQVASAVIAGTNGINVSAGATDVVILRNLRLNGLLGNGGAPGNAGITGISFNTGKMLIVDNCDIFGFNTNGVSVNTTGGYALINNTRIENVANAGVGVGGSNNQVEVFETRIVGSKFGVAVGNTNKLGFSRSLSTNATTQGLEVDNGGTLTVDDSVISFNGNGIGPSTWSSFTNNRFYGNISNGVGPTPLAGC
jgi:Right handed beta helix region